MFLIKVLCEAMIQKYNKNVLEDNPIQIFLPTITAAAFAAPTEIDWLTNSLEKQSSPT
jgi:hypothetical protein